MLLDQHNVKAVEDLLGFPAALAVLRQALNESTPVVESRVRAAAALLEVWNRVLDDETKQQSLMRRAAGRGEQPDAEQVAERLMRQVMGSDEDFGSSNGDGEDEDATPTPARVAAKAPPSPKTKPKQADEDAAPPLPLKYWITLGVLVVVGLGYLGYAVTGGPLSPAGLAKRALTDSSGEVRVAAVTELQAIQDFEATVQLRHVARECKNDPETLTIALTSLSVRGDSTSADLLFANLDNASEPVRRAAIAGLVRLLALPQDEYEMRVNDSPEKRAQLVKSLRDLQEDRQKSAENAKKSIASMTK